VQELTINVEGSGDSNGQRHVTDDVLATSSDDLLIVVVSLVASTSRGCKALNAGGGVTTVLTRDAMTRGPAIDFPSIVSAAVQRSAGQGALKRLKTGESRGRVESGRELGETFGRVDVSSSGRGGDDGGEVDGRTTSSNA
jgi:hypothetical protein